MLLVVNHEVNLTVWQDQGDAVPRVEGDVILVLRVKKVYVLSKHPESGADAAEEETLDVVKVAAG